MNQRQRDDIRFINKFLYAVQKHRISFKNWIDSKERDGINASKRVMNLFEEIQKTEIRAGRIAKEVVEELPIWEEFFEVVRGVDSKLATSLLAEIGDIARFDTVTKLWAYCAMIAEYRIANCENGHKLILSSNNHDDCPVLLDYEGLKCHGKLEYLEHITGKAPKRKAGYHYLFNNNLKMIAWKISEQLVKQGDPFFRRIYDTAKQRYVSQALSSGLQIIKSAELKSKKEKEKYKTEGHIHNMAKRKMAKMFLSYLWEAWRMTEGLPAKKPYVIEKLGHKNFIPWAKARQIILDEKADKRKRKAS